MDQKFFMTSDACAERNNWNGASPEGTSLFERGPAVLVLSDANLCPAVAENWNGEKLANKKASAMADC